MKTLSIIISERNDSVGTIVTICSAMEELSTTDISYEIVIVDNSDQIHHFRTLRNFISPEYIKEGKIKLLRQNHQCIFTARELAISNASGKYLLFLDSHCIFGRDSISNMLSFASSTANVGFTYGLMCFSVHHELDSFCDRDINSFIGIRLSHYNYKNSAFKIPFRGMPFLCTKKFFNEIGGYGTLAKNRLSWGGGDFLLGFKSAMLGYDNWMLTNSVVVHIGPFKNDCYIPSSYIREDGRGLPKRFGMIVTAYIIGGEKLVKNRIEQLTTRLGIDSLDERTYQKALEMGEEERRWLWKNAKKSYIEISKEFRHSQHRHPIKLKLVALPRSKHIKYDRPELNTTKTKNRRIKNNDSWQSRIAREQDRKKINQSIGVQK